MANGLVEAHNKILKSAVLSMNSTKKRSTGHTSFKVMWGRESRYEFLLPVINNLNSTPEEYLIEEEEVFAAHTELDILDQRFLTWGASTPRGAELNFRGCWKRILLCAVRCFSLDSR